MKQMLQRIPEIFFIGLGILWITENYLASGHINWIAIVLSVLLIIQLIVQNRVVGMSLGLVLGLICAYMMFAVLSEFRDFDNVNNEALQLLGVGLGIFGVGVLSATAMVYKFAVRQQNYMKDKSPLTA